MRLSRIIFFIALLYSFSACGSALVYQSWQEGLKNKTELNPLLLLLGGGTTPLVVEPVSWLDFPSTSVIFNAGNTGNYSIDIQYPYSGCPTTSLDIYTTNSGVSLSSQTCPSIYLDGCPLSNFTLNCTVSGSTAGNANVIFRISQFLNTAAFPELHANQIVGVVGVTVSP